MPILPAAALAADHAFGAHLRRPEAPSMAGMMPNRTCMAPNAYGPDRGESPFAVAGQADHRGFRVVRVSR